MRSRYLRITFFATCLIACVLLIVLWVRSYSVFDELRVSGKNLCIGSRHGEILLNAPCIEITWPGIPTTFDAFGDVFNYDAYSPTADRDPRGTGIHYCAPSLFFAVLAALPWLRWRFSLRTLLIATTLVAVVLWLIV